MPDPLSTIRLVNAVLALVVLWIAGRALPSWRAQGGPYRVLALSLLGLVGGVLVVSIGRLAVHAPGDVWSLGHTIPLLWALSGITSIWRAQRRDRKAVTMTTTPTPVESAPITTREPVLTTAAIIAGATAILALLVAFAVPLTPEQQVAILGVVAVAAPAIVSIARRWVTPNAAVVERIEDGAVVAGEGSELPTGEYVRAEGSLNTHRADA